MIYISYSYYCNTDHHTHNNWCMFYMIYSASSQHNLHNHSYLRTSHNQCTTRILCNLCTSYNYYIIVYFMMYNIYNSYALLYNYHSCHILHTVSVYFRVYNHCNLCNNIIHSFCILRQKVSCHQ